MFKKLIILKEGEHDLQIRGYHATKEMEKRICCLILAITLTVGMIFTGCSSKKNSGDEFGSYEGWHAGYNPLTGKVYD